MTQYWQPIATAPKDGTRILVAYDATDRDLQIVEWVDWKPGWFNGDYTYDPDIFEYWMPLPAPPGITDGELTNPKGD